MMMINDTIRQYIVEHQLFTKESRLLLAVSGGGDSVAMLDILCTEEYNCEVAHVNFMLRGEDSEADERLVTDLCNQRGLYLHKKRVDTREYAQKHKLSIEMAAREIRYDFFEKIMKERSLDCVAVAHHRNDTIETFFINLLRGTGLCGLSGIVPCNGKVVRPMLQVSHCDLLAYLEERGLEYAVDKTNFDTTILRNDIRHHLIPELENKKPGFTEIMQKTISRLRKSELIVEAYAEDWVRANVKKRNGDLLIPMSCLYKAVSPGEILFRILQPYGFSSAVIDELSLPKERRSGARYEGDKHFLTIDREYIIVSPIRENNTVYTLESDDMYLEQPMKVMISFADYNNGVLLKRDVRIAELDADKLTFPLTLRHWQEGDVFCPIGMGGKRKKVSDYFIDQKFSVPDKEKTWLLCSANDIVWIVGHRLDERFKVTEKTKRIYEMILV